MFTDPFLSLFFIILLYPCILFLAKFLSIGKKKIFENCTNACPNCNTPLNRIRRLTRDKILITITFKIFDFKRYVCNECSWEGLRWEEKYKPNSFK